MREHRTELPASPQWRKSSHSNRDGGDRVLVTPAHAWQAFVTAVRDA